MPEIRCPEIPDELILYLKQVFPDRAQDPAHVNPHEAWGSAKVIRHLEAVQETQRNNPDVSI